MLWHHVPVRKVCEHLWFELTMSVLILANMIVMGMDHYPQSQSYVVSLNGYLSLKSVTTTTTGMRTILKL